MVYAKYIRALYYKTVHHVEPLVGLKRLIPGSKMAMIEGLTVNKALLKFVNHPITYFCILWTGGFGHGTKFYSDWRSLLAANNGFFLTISHGSMKYLSKKKF